MEICHRYEKREALYRTGTKPTWFIQPEDSALHYISLPGVPWSQQHLLGIFGANCCSPDCRVLLQAETLLCAPCSARAWGVKWGVSELAFLALIQEMMVAPLESMSPSSVLRARGGAEPQAWLWAKPAAGWGSASPRVLCCLVIPLWWMINDGCGWKFIGREEATCWVVEGAALFPKAGWVEMPPLPTVKHRLLPPLCCQPHPWNVLWCKGVIKFYF